MVVRVESGIASGVGGDTRRANRPDVVGFTVVVPGDDLHKLGLDFEDLVPARGPEVVAAEDPVFAPLREVGVEPRGNGHHIWFSGESFLPVFVGGGIFVGVALRPGVPGESTVDVGLRDIERPNARPVRNEEAAGILFDCGPIALVFHAFKGGDEWFVLVAELSSASGISKCVDEVGGYTSIPHAIGFVVKGEEEAEVTMVFGSLSCEVDGRGSVGIPRGNVQRKGVDADIGRFGDVVEPVLVTTASSVAHLSSISRARHLVVRVISPP